MDKVISVIIVLILLTGLAGILGWFVLPIFALLFT
jgi:hypothetical protein